MKAHLRSGIALAAFGAVMAAPRPSIIQSQTFIPALGFDLNGGAWAQPSPVVRVVGVAPLTVTPTIGSQFTIGCPSCATGADEWQAGTVTALSGFSINAGTLHFNAGAGLAVASNTVVAQWQAGVVANIGAGITITLGTLTGSWQAPSVLSLGTGLANLSGVLTPNWQSSTVTALGSGLSNAGGTLNTAGSGINAATGLASIVSSTTLNVGTISAAAPTSFILGGSLNVINTVTATAVDNAIIGGSGDTIGAGDHNFIGAGSGNVIASSAADGAIVGGQNNTIAAGGGSGFIGAGSSNTISAGGGGVGGGDHNAIGGSASWAAGSGNVVNGNSSGAVGVSNTVTGQWSFATGHFNLASGEATFVPGSFTGDRGNTGAFIEGGLGGPGAGTAPNGAKGQSEVYTLFAGTTGATAVRLTSDGIGATSLNIGGLGTSMVAVWDCKIDVIDKTAFPNSVSYTIGPSVITRQGAASTTALGTGNPAAVAGPTAGTPLVLAAAPALTADVTNGGFNLSYTPPVANTDSLLAVAACRAVIIQTN